MQASLNIHIRRALTDAVYIGKACAKNGENCQVFDNEQLEQNRAICVKKGFSLFDRICVFQSIRLREILSERIFYFEIYFDGNHSFE